MRKGKKAASPAFVTSNPHKFAEAERVLKQFGVIIRHARLSCPEIRGEEPAVIAADSVRRLICKVEPPFFVEDAGLFVGALNGFPGPYSAWALGKVGLGGLLRLMEGARDRRASFRSAVALFDGKGVRVFEGEARGRIAFRARGENGFGYDPVFVPEGFRETFAEMSGARKDALSHRRKALEGMARFLLKG
ncbi:MAG: RdgB/HAM1 family non-canonical purine NTP pyrophosphatase [Candidatus ainarchaeum sp.]|nr:RdgB/HAM1 family non-canonical purine NTP pyrophosphatase [Candidatus ainarchaeum sp.]